MQFKVSPDSEANHNYFKNKQAQGQISFKGIEALGDFTNRVFAQVQTNKIVEYAGVDTVSMVIPRTIVDYTRSEDAGNETLRREVTAAASECLVPGVLAAGVGALLGKFVVDRDLKINTAFPIETDTLKMLKGSWDHATEKHGDFYSEGVDKRKFIEDYVDHAFSNGKGLTKDGWIELADKAKEPKDQLIESIVNSEKKFPRKEMNALKADFISGIGASENIRIDINGNKKDYIHTTVNRLVDGIHYVGRTLSTVGEGKTDDAIKKITAINPKKAAVAMAIICGTGFFQQHINRYLTKKKSGSDAFVGLSEEERKASAAEKNNPASRIKLNIAKALSVGTILGLGATTIADSCKWSTIKERIGSYPKLIKKLEFNGWFPHVNQLRAFYAAIIAGRMIVAADKHELRETFTRDIPGFLNWLVLGGIVSKWVGSKISGGELINSAESVPDGAGKLARFKNFLINKHLTSHAEIDARKLTPETAKEILTRFKKNVDGKTSEQLIIAAKRTLKNRLTGSIAAGIVYSAVMLGWFMPMLNKHITKKLIAKKKQPENTNTSAQLNISNVSDVNKLSFKDAGNYKNNENFAEFIKIQQKLKKA